MATIPQAIDLGARPSLRVSRIDMPGQGQTAIAEAVALAADRFATIMVERKDKQDKFNYSMAKQEYLTADLENREKLRDDTNWATHDERYLEGIRTDRDRITDKYQLTPHDRAIFDAEADFIEARGRAAVGEAARVREIDDNLAKLDGSLAISREKAILAEPGTRRDVLLTALDQINAAEEKGYLSDVEAETKRQEFAQDVAMASLISMDPEEREKVLEQSLTARKVGGPLSTDDIRAGKGTGSIADFLHTDTATKLLDQTKKQNEEDNALRDGYAISDRVYGELPGIENQTKREARIRELAPDAKTRQEAMMASRQRQNAEVSADNANRREIMETLMNRVDDGAGFGDLDSELRRQLTETERTRLRGYARSVRESDGFADHDDWDTEQMWRNMSQSQRAAVDLDGFIPLDPENIPYAPTDQITWKMMLTRDTMDAMAAQQAEAQRSISAGKPDTLLTDTQMIEAYLLETPFFTHKPTKADPEEYQNQWSRVLKVIDERVTLEGLEKTVSPARKRQIASDVLRWEVFVSKDYQFDKKYPLAALTDEQVKNAYIPLDEPLGPNRQTAYTTFITVPATETSPKFRGTAYEWLRETGKSLNKAGEYPDDDLLAQAYFYLVTEGRAAAVRQLTYPEEY